MASVFKKVLKKNKESLFDSEIPVKNEVVESDSHSSDENEDAKEENKIGKEDLPQL